MINAFEEIKSQIDITDAAEHFGIRVNKNGRALCFAHDDHTPSLSFKNNFYYCFACGASGDVISMVQHLHSITPLEAAKILDNMYGLSLFKDNYTAQDKRNRAAQIEKHQSEKERIQAFEVWECWACSVCGNYVKKLRAWRTQYAPKSPDEPLHPLFVESLNRLDFWDNLHEAVFIGGDFETRVKFYQSYSEEVKKIAKRIYGRTNSFVA